MTSNKSTATETQVTFSTPAAVYGKEMESTPKVSEGQTLSITKVEFSDTQYGPQSVAKISALEGEFHTTSASIVGLLKRYVSDGHIGNGKGMKVKVISKKANTGRFGLSLAME
jgi:hypothetical protein